VTISKQGTVPTERAQRYAKQLASHWERKTEQATVEDGTVLTFESGNVVVLRPADGGLDIEVSVPEGGDLDRFAQVVAEHLQRFGQRDELEVVWS